MPRLLVHSPEQVPFSVECRDGMRIGRHPQSDLVLSDTKASRRHAILRCVEGAWTLADEGSTHGMLVNRKRVESAHLHEGDQIQIGEVVLVFSEEAAAEEVLHRQLTERPDHRDDAAARLRIFYDVAAAIVEIEDLDALLGRMLEAILDVLGCERALAGLQEADGLRAVSRARSGAPSDKILIGRELLDAILKRRESVIIHEPPRQGTLGRQQITAAMGVPLLAGTRHFGLLYVDERSHRGRFSEEDLAFLAALGHLTAAALESAERYRRAATQGAPTGADALAALTGDSDAMSALRAEIRKCAAASAHVQIHGESGTGKELVARALHALSPRAARPFVTLNCAAIPETMIESELFGYQRGAFTGAVKDKRGMFVLAHRGTLFLDEVGDLGPAAQAKLLRAIQEGEVQPVGAERTEHVDVRVVSATHKDLQAEVSAGRFREDLFYRLAVVEISVPPLRARGDDVIKLAADFVEAAARRLAKPIAGFSSAALALLRAHPWPGNVRELQNECERAVILSEGPYIEPESLSVRVRGHASLRAEPAGGLAPGSPRPPSSVSPATLRNPPALPPPSRPSASGGPPGSLAERFAQLEPTEKALVEEALAAARGNISEAARLLGVSRIMMRRRVERFGLSGRDD